VSCLLADVDHSTVFVKLLKKLRPAYDWVPTTAAAPAAAQASMQQQQDEQVQQQGHWQACSLSDATLKELKLTRPEQEVRSRAWMLPWVFFMPCIPRIQGRRDQQDMVGANVANMQQLLIHVHLLVAVMCAVLP
jgi:hypothetical protein